MTTGPDAAPEPAPEPQITPCDGCGQPAPYHLPMCPVMAHNLGQAV